MKVRVIVFVRCLETDVAIMSVVHFWTSELVETVVPCAQSHFGQAWYQETDAGICFEKRQSSITMGNVLILCWLSRTFCLSGLMNGKINKKPSKWRDGARNGVIGEVGLWRVSLGSQANTIWQWPRTTCLPSFITIRSSVLLEFTFLSNSGAKTQR